MFILGEVSDQISGTDGGIIHHDCRLFVDVTQPPRLAIVARSLATDCGDFIPIQKSTSLDFIIKLEFCSLFRIYTGFEIFSTF
jgi:hypothetical protein